MKIHEGKGNILIFHPGVPISKILLNMVVL